MKNASSLRLTNKLIMDRVTFTRISFLVPLTNQQKVSAVIFAKYSGSQSNQNSNLQGKGEGSLPYKQICQFESIQLRIENLEQEKDCFKKQKEKLTQDQIALIQQDFIYGEIALFNQAQEFGYNFDSLDYQDLKNKFAALKIEKLPGEKVAKIETEEEKKLKEKDLITCLKSLIEQRIYYSTAKANKFMSEAEIQNIQISLDTDYYNLLDYAQKLDINFKPEDFK